MAQSSFPEDQSTLPTVEAIRSNNETALRQLYRCNFPKVEAFVLNNNGSSEQAKDVFQEAFIAVWRNIQLDRFQPRSESAVDGYLYQIARNKWIDQLRWKKHTKVIRIEDTVPGDAGAISMSTEEDEYLAAVKKHIGALGESCRKLLKMYYYDNESLRAIAQAMGWTEPTAKNNKYRCMQKLKERLTQKK